MERARELAKRLSAKLAIIDKRRDKPGVAHAMHIIGKVKNKNVFIVDDMIDTAGTITGATRALLDKGARAVYAICTHPVLSGPAIERLSGSNFKPVLVVNTIPLNGKVKVCKKVKIVSIASL